MKTADKLHTFSEVKLIYKTKVKPSLMKKVTTSSEVYSELKKVYDEDKIEHIESFVILLLNRANKILGWKTISEGGITGTVADIRVIFQCAILSNATRIVISHNHPSGNLNPSQQDIELTKRIKEAGKILDISLIDHLILTSEAYYSFADERGL